MTDKCKVPCELEGTEHCEECEGRTEADMIMEDEDAVHARRKACWISNMNLPRKERAK